MSQRLCEGRVALVTGASKGGTGFAGAIPVGRTGRPEDVAAACVSLASDEAEWVTAQTIGISGGSLTS